MDIKKRLSDISEQRESRERQERVSELLSRLNPKIADVYRGGIKVLEQEYPEKIPQSSHSLREVIYMLTRLDEIKEFGRVKTKSQASTRKQDLIKSLDPVKGISEDVYVLYDKLVDDMLKWFSIVAHHSESYTKEEKFRKRVIELEELLEKILKPHFEVINEIDKLLTIKKPKKKNFENLKHLLSRNSSAYNYFFQNASATWLPLLLKEKYLKDPKHIVDIEGQRKFIVWSPAIYLWKSAKEQPNEVSKIIINFKTPKKNDQRNPWLLDYFLKAALEMPPKHCKLFAKKIFKEKWLETAYHHYLDRPISELMKKLADAGFENETILLARSLLNIKLGQPYVTGGILEEYKKTRDVKPVVDNYWFEELLKNEIPYVFEKFPIAVTNLCVELVTNMIFLENIGRGNKKSKTDASVGWRPAIEDHEQNWAHDFRSQLVGTLGNFLIALGSKSISSLKQTLKKISEIEYPVFRRLELFVYWSFPKYFKKQIDYAIENYFDEYELHHEYFHLLKNCFQNASKKTREKYLSYVGNGPDKKHIEFWEARAENQESGFVDLKIRIWKAKHLKPVKEFLTKEEKEKFLDFIDEEKGFPYPDFHVYSSGVKRSEPKSELKDNLTPDEVFEFIKNYTVKELDFGYHDGTPEKFQEYVSKESENYSNLALRCIDLNSIFKYRFFRGIEEAIKQKQMIKWESVLSLCERIIDSNKKGESEERGEFDTINSIVSVLEEGIESDSIDFVFRNRIWKLLKDLVILQDVDPSWEDGYPRKDWDAFGLSINTTNGKTFHSIMKYVIWCENHLKKKKFLVPEAKELLTNYLEQKIPTTVSRQAVLGYYLSTLYYYDKNWIRNKLNNLFKNQSEAFSVAAWDGYLIGKVYADIFKDLIPQYNIHVKKLISPPLKDDRLWEYDERVIHHITLGYLFKIKESQQIFTDMIENSHEKVRSHCAWFIGRILKEHKEKPTKSFDIEAFRKLWKNSTLTSNEELRSWVEYSPFNKKETLDLLYNSLKKSTKTIRFLSFLVEELEPYAITHPQSTLKCLDLLIRKRATDPEFHIARERLKNILKILLKKNATKDKTTSLIHYLGELGLNEYKDLFDES